jgi:hypothetical protein
MKAVTVSKDLENAESSEPPDFTNRPRAIFANGEKLGNDAFCQ